MYLDIYMALMACSNNQVLQKTLWTMETMRNGLTLQTSLPFDPYQQDLIIAKLMMTYLIHSQRYQTVWWSQLQKS